VGVAPYRVSQLVNEIGVRRGLDPFLAQAQCSSRGTPRSRDWSRTKRDDPIPAPFRHRIRRTQRLRRSLTSYASPVLNRFTACVPNGKVRQPIPARRAHRRY
jgi:hypothetical protein